MVLVMVEMSAGLKAAHAEAKIKPQNLLKCIEDAAHATAIRRV
jgi:hypothetical protein